MYNLNEDEFELDVLSSSQIGLFSESPVFVEYDSVVFLNDSPSSDVLRGIENDVIKNQKSLSFLISLNSRTKTRMETN